MNYVLDTHTLYWYLCDPGKLPTQVDEIIMSMDNGDDNIAIIPTIVLAEIQYIFEKRKAPLNLLEEIIHEIEKKPFFKIVPFSRDHLLLLPKLRAIREMHDRIIVAIAKACEAKIISKDRNIKKWKSTEVVW
ncbi:MAG: PIN domain-containing protein [bacterium]